MTAINRIYRRLASDEIGHGARLMAWIFALINLPGFLFALVFIWAWPLTIPGMILYVNYWRSAFDKLSWSSTKSLWMWSLFYNLLLVVLGTAVIVDSPSWGTWGMVLPSILGSGMSAIAIRALNDHKTELARSATLLGAELAPEYDSNDEVQTSESNQAIPVENWTIA